MGKPDTYASIIMAMLSYIRRYGARPVESQAGAASGPQPQGDPPTTTGFLARGGGPEGEAVGSGGVTAADCGLRHSNNPDNLAWRLERRRRRRRLSEIIKHLLIA